MKSAKLALIALAAACSMPAWSINKCTGKDGATIYQDAPCGTSSAAAQPVKTWENSTDDGYRVGASTLRHSSRVREVEPDVNLSGPPHAQAVIGLYRRWIDAERLARATPRIALPGPAASMQALQREAEALSVPSCLAEAKRGLVELVTRSTDAMLQFMAKEELSGMVFQLLDKPKLVPQFEREVRSARCG